MTEPARNFQHYELLRRDDGTPWELGRGAMGITYKAFDVNLCCEVALKVVSSALVEHPEARERFVREARAAAALRHRNVASVYHLGNDGEHFFYAMEFINGETLDALVRRGGPLSVENTLKVILQVARALAAAERQGLVHRDIKPANLMVTHEDADEETVVKVIDFGLARPAATAENAAPLTIGGFVGTPQYASPEQLEERPLDARSDFYSLGVTAWFLLTGRVPFTGSLATVCQQQLTQPPPWEQLSADVPTCVRGLLGHTLAKDAARRPQNAGELRAEIETCLGKVEGTERKRDLHLGALPAARATARPPDAAAAARTPQVGSVLAGRYRLLREIGGNHGIRVHQARDEARGDKPVVVKILPPGLASDAAARSRFAEEVRLVQAAAHPNLVQVLGLEQSTAPPLVFLVEEFLTGFSLRDLLAGRGGALPVSEAFRLLEQAAAATDHAARCRLGMPPLDLTDLHVCFPSLAGASDDGAAARPWLPRGIDEWPEWRLKVPALRVQADPLALDTWAGGNTLLPTAGTGGPGTGGPGESVQALARMVYELLGGTPARRASLPALNEEGNRVLRQTLSGEAVFIHGGELHAALVRAIGEEPARGQIYLPAARLDALPAPAAEETFERGGFSPEVPEPESESAATSYGLPTARPGSKTPTGEVPSVAPFFQTGHDPDVLVPDEQAAGSAWERLTLVTGRRAHPGRWVAGIIGLATVFMLGFAGVLAWLFEQPSSRPTVVPPPLKKRAVEVAASRPATRQATPSPLPTVRPMAVQPTATAPHREPLLPVATASAASVETVPPSPSPSPPVLARTEHVPPTPSVVAPPAADLAPASEKFAMVRMDTLPEGAQIRLGDEVLGTTPCRVRVPAGDHQLIARYQNWPETRQTVHLDGTELHAAVEIRLMRPELVPGLAPASSGMQDNHARRIVAPATRRFPRLEPPALAAPLYSPATEPTPNQTLPLLLASILSWAGGFSEAKRAPAIARS